MHARENVPLQKECSLPVIRQLEKHGPVLEDVLKGQLDTVNPPSPYQSTHDISTYCI